MGKFWLFFVLLFTFKGMSQSNGYSILTTIETKANKIEDNNQKVSLYNRQHHQSYVDEARVLDSLKNELAWQKAENERIMEELKNGRFCNGCSQTASQLRNNGVTNVNDHFNKNGGTRPPRQSEIDAKEAELERLTTAIEVQLEKFKTGNNRFSQLREALDNKMNNLRSNSDNLRSEIQSMSKQYKEVVVQEGKQLTSTYLNELMHILANKHFVENRIDIALVKLTDLAAEEVKAVEKSNHKIRSQVEDEKKKLSSEIILAKNRFAQLKDAFRLKMNEILSDLAIMERELSSLKSQLQSTPASKTNDIKALETQIQETDSKAASIRMQIKALQTEYEKHKLNSEAEIKKLSDDSWNLTINLSRIQQDAVNVVKQGFIVKRKALNDVKNARSTSLQEVGSELINRKSALRNKFMEYSRALDGERIRLINSCQKAGASCYGFDTQGTVVSNWNIAEGCVGEIDAAKNSKDPMYGCTEEYSVYKLAYASFMSGVSDSDMDALKRRNGQTQFDMILRKIN